MISKDRTRTKDNETAKRADGCRYVGLQVSQILVHKISRQNIFSFVCIYLVLIYAVLLAHVCLVQ
jgi:hypothetical protein